MNNLDTNYFIKAVTEFTKQNQLERSYAKITEILNDGFYINCKLIDTSISSQEYKNIPVLKNKYFNTPLLKDDTVMLLTLSTLMDDFLETGRLEKPQKIESYFAIPVAMLQEFKHKNEFSLKTQKEKYSITCNDDDGLKINETVAINSSDFKIQNLNVSVESNKVAIKSNAPIEIGGTDTLGGILSDLVSTLSSALTGPLAPSGTTTSFDVGTITKLNALLTKIKTVLK